MANYPSADYFKDFLHKIYPCKEPFELLVVDKKPKTRAGVYIYDTHRIRIYAPWGHLKETARIRIYAPWGHLKETAIHEYAHHIHYTECGSKAHGERPHGPQFWEIYGALMCVAVQKGLYVEERIEKIAKF